MEKLENKTKQFNGKHTFKKFDNTKSIINILQAEKIGSWCMWDIYRIDAEIDNKSMVYAIKDYWWYPKNNYKSYNDFLKHQLQVHHELKDANLPTWTTCRMHNKKKQLLLSYGNKKSLYSLLSVEETDSSWSTNINEENKLYKNNLDPTINFEDFLKKLATIVVLAVEKNIFIYASWYFVLYDHEKKSISPFIGDIDNVSIEEDWTQEEVRDENIWMIRWFCSKFIEQYASKEKQTERKEKCDTWINKQNKKKNVILKEKDVEIKID